MHPKNAIFENLAPSTKLFEKDRRSNSANREESFFVKVLKKRLHWKFAQDSPVSMIVEKAHPKNKFLPRKRFFDNNGSKSKLKVKIVLRKLRRKNVLLRCRDIEKSSIEEIETSCDASALISEHSFQNVTQLLDSFVWYYHTREAGV